MVKIDQYDRKILGQLDQDSRLSAAKIGKAIQLPKESVTYRIKRLLKSGVIVYFNTLINASMFGHSYYRVSIKLHQHTKKDEDAIISFLLDQRTCTNIRVTDGPYDLVFMSIHENAREFSEFISRLGKKLQDKIIVRNISLITRSQKFNQKVLLESPPSKVVMLHDKPSAQGIDYNDMKILKYLALKGRSKLTEIGIATKLKPGIVRYRMKKLEKQGIIAGYSTLLDFEKLGYNFVQIDFSFEDPQISASVLEFFDMTCRLIRSYEVLGKYDLSVELYIESDKELRGMLDSFKAKFRKDYLYYDISRIFKNYITSWSPFLPLEEVKIREIRLQE